MSDDIDSELQKIHAKLDKLIVAIEELRSVKRKTKTAEASRKTKLPPSTEDEVAAYKAEFTRLFDRWMAGEELEVQNDLEKRDVEQLRRLADANNLNVTAKMPSQRVLQLVAARFREMRQLRGGPRRGSIPDGRRGPGGENN
ncbi:hypothetical protein A9R16_000170 [Acidiferrobacter thiooxydans]|jgi:hypothetical protein|uniref:hypothetical protein n=1 Tax=Acidiferrobacter thiooxydans TaxID=163359 RepID=UPI001146E138|nr:hypothetical protein [Acidiferrobacter thiooxydans]UEN99845.1 hypothetical protein A9R16_000170 [Acidiferrobacter thiooxydans]